MDSTLTAIMKLKSDFSLIIADGQGIAHPRRFGIASHLGVLLNIPAIGCAKKRLVGKFQMPENISGAFTYLYDGEEKIGAVLRTKVNVKPLFISPGHLVDIESSVRIIISLIGKYRLPEPVREAHLYGNKLRVE
ncbi:MAG: endonuclease V [Proteobacteria bacterium]|nr:endonuclease V [Pseudomonadota bacterium]